MIQVLALFLVAADSLRLPSCSKGPATPEVDGGRAGGMGYPCGGRRRCPGGRLGRGGWTTSAKSREAYCLCLDQEYYSTSSCFRQRGGVCADCSGVSTPGSSYRCGRPAAAPRKGVGRWDGAQTLRLRCAPLRVTCGEGWQVAVGGRTGPSTLLRAVSAVKPQSATGIASLRSQ
jgi:hypothetical protein